MLTVEQIESAIEQLSPTEFLKLLKWFVEYLPWSKSIGKKIGEPIKPMETQEVIITCQDGTAFKIIPLQQAESYPKFGSAKGLVKISDDFDAPLEDFEAYAP